jgi:hypothetical protein
MWARRMDSGEVRLAVDIGYRTVNKELKIERWGGLDRLGKRLHITTTVAGEKLGRFGLVVNATQPYETEGSDTENTRLTLVTSSSVIYGQSS